MKKAVVLFLLVIAIAKLHGQSYYEISFTGTGATPDSIFVENLTKGTSVSMQGGDVLHLDLVVGVHEIDKVNDKLVIYPNPMEHSCHFEFVNSNQGRVNLQLYTANGRLVHSVSKELPKGKHGFILSGVPAGAYNLSIQTPGEHIAGRFVSAGPSKGVLSLLHTGEISLPETGEIIAGDRGKAAYKPGTKGTKAIVNMDFTIGDQLRFIGFATGFHHDTVFASPTGNQIINFVFIAIPTVPVVTTTAVTSVTSTSAISGGNVTADGGANVTIRGVCWSTSANPVVTGNHTTSGTGTGTFTSNITGLTQGTTYYVRAYAINSVGIAYGNELTFTTIIPATVPVVTTTAVTSITTTAAISGGNVTADGGASVTARGVCWSTSTNPVVTGNHTTNGIDTGTFTSNITGLSPSTTYYVRAYATNSVGTAYGNEISFTTISASSYPPGYVHCTPTAPTAVVDVINPSTGKIWMDRNLGASQVANSSTDANSFGDLYQWGRFADGHQCRTSATTATLSTSDQPGHGNFILAPGAPYDWRNPQNTNLWQGLTGANNPCPSGYRLPTGAELTAEQATWSFSSATGAFASPLKFPLAGFRANSTGSLQVGYYASYWSSTVSSNNSSYLSFDSGFASMYSDYRANGNSVRCIKGN